MIGIVPIERFQSRGRFMGKRIRTRVRCEITAEREADGWWTWSVFHKAYRWNGDGWIESLEPDGAIIRHYCAETIDCAIGWTVGHAIAIYHAAGFMTSKECERN